MDWRRYDEKGICRNEVIARMIVILLILITICVILSLPAWRFRRKKVNWYVWDYGVPAYGIIVWIILGSLNVGTLKSLSNLVELIWVSIVALICPWLRVLFPGKDKRDSIFLSIIFLSLPIITAILLILFGPTLPE